MEIHKIQFIKKGRNQHFLIGQTNPFSIPNVFTLNSNNGYFVIYSDTKSNSSVMEIIIDDLLIESKLSI